MYAWLKVCLSVCLSVCNAVGGFATAYKHLKLVLIHNGSVLLRRDMAVSAGGESKSAPAHHCTSCNSISKRSDS